jgi:hypothetical protein
LDFFAFAKDFPGKILKFSLKMVKMVKNVSKPVWLQARELKFCMPMLCYFKYKIAYSGLDFFGIFYRVFLKNPEIFFKNGQNGQKFV